MIGLFKLFKALLSIAVGIGAIKFLHKDLASTMIHLVQVLRVDPDNTHVHRILERIFRITPKQKRWAEYLTIIGTGGLIPLEIYELARHLTVTRLAVVFVNVLIVWYLVSRVGARNVVLHGCDRQS